MSVYNLQREYPKANQTENIISVASFLAIQSRIYCIIAQVLKWQYNMLDQNCVHLFFFGVRWI